MEFRLNEAPVDGDGLLTQSHIASHHVGNGEQTLCGLYIYYPTFKGVAPDAPECETCIHLDG